MVVDGIVVDDIGIEDEGAVVWRENSAECGVR
jgi:hypothetical protein